MTAVNSRYIDVQDLNNMAEPFFPTKDLDDFSRLEKLRRFGCFETTPKFPSTLGGQTAESIICILFNNTAEQDHMAKPTPGSL